MGKVNDFMKTDIKDYVPISRSTNSWSNFIKKRKDIQYTGYG